MDTMDNKSRWDWLPRLMPGVTKLIRDKRAAHGSAYVDECWKRGVVLGEPGWFFASEGALHVGALWPEAMHALLNVQAMAADLAGNAAAMGLQGGQGFEALRAPLLVLRPAQEGGANAE